MDASGWPIWAVVVKRAVTILVLALFGLHAYVQWRRRGEKIPGAERLVFLAFAVAFLFAVVANFDALQLAVKLGIKKGPFNFGLLSLLLSILYMIFAVRVARRARF